MGGPGNGDPRMQVAPDTRSLAPQAGGRAGGWTLGLWAAPLSSGWTRPGAGVPEGCRAGWCRCLGCVIRDGWATGRQSPAFAMSSSHAHW